MEFNSKKQLRTYMLDKRENMDETEKLKWDEEIFNKLIESQFYKSSKVIFTYVSYKKEVDTHSFINTAIRDNKIICVPKVNSKDKEMYAYKINSFKDLKNGYYGILEPSNEVEKLYKNTIDLIIMPGLAFDLNGGRIGYGGGYYDKFLEDLSHEVKTIALGYKFQVITEVPMEKYDKKVNEIITNY